MLDTIYPVVLDVDNDKAIIKKAIKFKENDSKTSFIQFQIIEGGDVVTFEADDKFTLETLCEEEGSVKFTVQSTAFTNSDDNKLTKVELPDEVLSKVGKHKCILVMENNGKIKHTALFEIEIIDVFCCE